MRASHCSGFSCCGVRALGTRASVVAAHGLSSCGSQALERRLSSCGARASLLHGMWDHPGPGLEPVSPALAGGFLTTAPPGKSCLVLLFVSLATAGSICRRGFCQHIPSERERGQCPGLLGLWRLPSGKVHLFQAREELTTCFKGPLCAVPWAGPCAIKVSFQSHAPADRS